MPKNKTKKNGAANRIRRTANPIVNRRNRNNATNNNNGTIEYNSNNIENNNNVNMPQTQAQILRSALRQPGNMRPRKTVRAKPINMSTVRPRTNQGETYLVHKRTGDIYAPAFQTRVHQPRAVYDVNSLNDGTSYNVKRAFPVQIRQYNVSRAEYRGARNKLLSNTLAEYVKKNKDEIIYIQQYVPAFINKYYELGILTDEDKKAIRKGVERYVKNKYTAHIQGNVRSYNELTQEEKNAIDFQDNIFRVVQLKIDEMLSKVFQTDKDFAIGNLQAIIFIYKVFNEEKLMKFLPPLPQDLDSIVFPQSQ